MFICEEEPPPFLPEERRSQQNPKASLLSLTSHQVRLAWMVAARKSQHMIHLVEPRTMGQDPAAGREVWSRG